MNSGELTVTIVIPNWNGQHLLTKNLPSVIKAFKNPLNRIKKVIVVDDGSNDDSLEIIKSFPEISWVKRKRNGGFSKAVNSGVSRVTTDLVCLLNNDCTPDEHFLEKIYENFDDKELFAVSLHERGNGPSIGKFKKGFVEYQAGKEVRNTSDTFWVSGGGGVFRMSIWNKLNGLDDKLFSPFYWEDTDICYRAQKRGYSVMWDSRCLINHTPESTVKRSRYSVRMRQYIIQRNQLRFIWKNITSRNLIFRHIKGLSRRVYNGPGYLIVIIMALYKFPWILKYRIRESRESIVSDEAIFERLS